MKKISLLSLLVLWALAAPAASQTTLGFHLGANIADLGGDDVDGTETRTGMNIGASLLFPLAENLGLHLEGSYSEKGADISDPEVDGSFKLDYLEFPVLLRYGFPTAGSVGVHLYGGGAVGVEINCELEGSDGSVSATVDCDDAGIETKSVDFGLMGGAGVDFGLANDIDLVVDLFYNLGLTSVDDSGADGNVKNRAFTIRAGVAIPLG